MSLEQFLSEIFNYNNSFKVIVNSILKNSKEIIPFEVSQFDKNIRFKFKNLQYTNNIIYVDPNINLAMHHYLINTRGDVIKNLLNNIGNETSVTNANNIGLLNNIIFGYIATSKFSTPFFNTNLIQFEILQNSLICNRTLIGTFNYQYLSQLTNIIPKKDWDILDDFLKIKKIHESDSEIFIEMLKIAPETINLLIEKKLLEEEYLNLNKDQILDLYRNIIEANYKMSKDYSYEYDVLDFKNNKIDKESICQILYDFNYKKTNSHVEIELDGLVINSEILKNINLEGTKTLNLNDVIKKIKNENELFSINLKEIEKAAFLKK